MHTKINVEKIVFRYQKIYEKQRKFIHDKEIIKTTALGPTL